MKKNIVIYKDSNGLFECAKKNDYLSSKIVMTWEDTLDILNNFEINYAYSFHISNPENDLIAKINKYLNEADSYSISISIFKYPLATHKIDDFFDIPLFINPYLFKKEKDIIEDFKSAVMLHQEKIELDLNLFKSDIDEIKILIKETKGSFLRKEDVLKIINRRKKLDF